MKPYATVITAVHNGAPFIRETIDSVRAQTFEDWEYLIVDDCSADSTCDIVQAMAEDDSRIRLIRRRESGGPFVAANDGLRQAQGTYIFRTDADDTSSPDRFDRQLAFMRANPDIKACTTYSVPLHLKGAIIPADFLFPPTTSAALKWYLFLCCPLNHSSLCIEREAFASLGWYRELRNSQDYRLWCMLARKGWLAVVSEVLAFWRIHPKSLTKTVDPGPTRQIVADLLMEHVTDMRLDWSKDDIFELYDLGLRTLPKGRGIRALARWDQAWLNDDSLSESDTQYLFEASSRVRRNFMRANIRHDPMGFLRNIRSFLAPNP